MANQLSRFRLVHVAHTATQHRLDRSLRHTGDFGPLRRMPLHATDLMAMTAVIRDDVACWMVQATVPGHDVEAAAEGPARTIYAVLESFRVHEEKPAEDAKDD